MFVIKTLAKTIFFINKLTAKERYKMLSGFSKREKKVIQWGSVGCVRQLWNKPTQCKISNHFFQR